MLVSRFWRAEFWFHVEDYILFLREIKYVATSFSPARMDLALKLLTKNQESHLKIEIIQFQMEDIIVKT